MRKKTYNEIIAYLRSFSNQHLDVKRFEEEDEDQMSSVTSMDEKFPMIFATPTGNEFDYELNGYTLRIYCYDRLMKDRSNIQNIRSKTNQILNDLDVWLRKESSLPFEIDEISDVTPFSSELMANVSGWYIDLTIDVPSYSVCDIPFNTLPLSPTYDCDDNVGDYYLRCDDLDDCPTIIDIQADLLTIDTVEYWTVEVMDELTVDFYTSFTMSIDMYNEVLNSTDITILVNDITYTLGGTINTGDKITVTTDSPAVISLKIIKQ